MSGPVERLRHEVRAEIPPAIAALSDADVETLIRLLADARARQRAALEQALDDGLSFVPRMLRGAVKRALGM